MGIKITGTGAYFPERIITNDDLASIVDTSDEWITKRTGIKERRMGSGEYAFQMGNKAAVQALEEAGITADEVDLILATTITPDCFTPSLACMIGHELHNDHAAAMDINGACTGFIYALDIAQNYLMTGYYKNILIVSVEILSHLMDFKDRSTCILFGDGAAAAVVTWQDGLYAPFMGGNPMGAFKLFAKTEFHKGPWDNNEYSFNNQTADEASNGYLVMNGEEIFKFAASKLPEAVEKATARAGIAVNDLAVLVPHQANERIIKAANRKLHLPEEKIYFGIQDYGNISSACIPFGLHRLKEQKRLKEKDKVCLAGFGAGLTYGAIVFEW